MNLDFIFNQIKQYQTLETDTSLSAQLKKIISANGLDIFKDIDRLCEEIQKMSVSKTLKAQLVLLFSCSNVANYVLNSKSDLNMVDVDNVVQSVIRTTGLNYDTAIKLIVDIFYACGMQYSVELGPQLVDNSVEYRLHAIIPSDKVEIEVKEATDLYEAFKSRFGKSSAEDKDDAAIQYEANRVIEAINTLCSAGISDGFYLLGRCYLYGDCNTAVDKEKAMQLMKIAADHGNSKAAACLGDLYYESDDVLKRSYTTAHYYYTRPGSVALGSKQQTALQDIYKQEKANRSTLVFSGIIFALMIAFVSIFHRGIFTGSNRVAVGVIMLVLSFAAIAGAVVYYIKNRYNGIRWLNAVQFFLWAFYAFILVLA